MEKGQIVQEIQHYFADKPVERAWLFGSFARGEQEADSDIDVLLELDFSEPIGLEYIHWWMDLEKKLNRKVDLVCEGTLSKYIIPFVNQDKQLIYER
ncbi:nucleotidyltransferase family protein [Spirosoma foliorum]|uniref:Nucleotidyltransferase domain-containing protein n=1 Tax=Spirosoma foliorum TaxID=2710596 RepID=A0A7G5H445_9BACT|nr:nucleotidyltransferase domain-containing protein [Spirosoma foliorum]QMW05887.1 nucleotidyltransferase domain-containing protein [Spirosoma foliorum]